MKHSSAFRVAIKIAALLSISTKVLAAAVTPVELLCEYRENPLGIDESQPRLSWQVKSSKRAEGQSAYRIIVAASESGLHKNTGDLWDSGKVVGSRTVNVVYEGKPLTSRAQCFWKVCVWDSQGRATWSKPAKWTMGLLNPSDWEAAYISFRDTSPIHKNPKELYLPPAHQYRKEFDAKKSVRRATIYATALGIYELHLNGRRVGDEWFAPGWSDYRQGAYYQTYDVTTLLRKGDNALGAWVADGWYSGYLGFGLLTGIGTERIGRYSYGKTPALMAQLEIEYADGSREMVLTDSTWKVSGDGPIREADFLMGEFYDARKETPGWSAPNYDDRSWSSAIRAEENVPAPATFYEFQNPDKPGGPVEVKGRPIDLAFQRPPVLEAFPGVPIRPIEEIKPIAITSPTNGVYIFNLGQNFAGVIRLKVKGAAGTQIRLRYGEMLHPDGTLMTENLRKARSIDHYILRGDPRGETYTPRFTFHGFQYVEISGYPGKPGRDAITGIVLHSDTPLAGGFECSDPVVNRLYKNIVWTQRANFLDLPTDCPQRDERFGWTGDAQAFVRAATYNADVAAFYTKWLRELMESQRPSGTFPGYAPFPFQHGWDFGTAWCDAGVICPWTIWKVYDDKRVIERCWPYMVKFIEWRRATSKDDLGVAHGNAWGDWLSLGGETPIDYVDTIYFAYSTKLMAEMASVLGKENEAAGYRDLFNRINTAFNKKYVKPDGSLAVETQTAYTLALFVGLIPEDLRIATGAMLARKIRERSGPKDSGMGTGFLGTRPLLPVLSSVNQHALALELLQSRKFPSWGFEVENGATTIWERWNSYTKENGFGGKQNAEMNSFSHYAFGAVGEWMFSQLAGIDTDGPGYERIVIRPSPPKPGGQAENRPIDWVKAHHDSIRGRIVSNWKLANGRFELETTLPANTSGTVYLPTMNVESVRESGKPLAKAKGVKLLRAENGHAVLAVESGTYRFSATFGN